MVFLRNLMRAPLRSLLTVVGIGCGVALAVAVVTITADLQTQIDSAAGQYRMEIVITERRATSPMSSRISALQMAVLAREYGDDLVPLTIGTLHEPWNPYALVIGAEQRFVRRVPLVRGQPFAPESTEVAVGELMALRLGLSPGDTLSLGGRSLRVAAVFRSGSRLFDSGVLGDIGLAQSLLARTGDAEAYSVAALHVTGARTPDDVIRHIQARHANLRAAPGTELSGSLRLIRIVRAFVDTIAVIAIALTCILLVNTLAMAVGERTREIGILMAIGWSPGRVLRLLLAESMVLSAAGALLGILFAIGVLHAVNRMPSVGFGWIPVQVDPLRAAQAVAVALLMSVAALLWPAVVLWRMQPLAALRHE